jgi:hypothetical protein
MTKACRAARSKARGMPKVLPTSLAERDGCPYHVAPGQPSGDEYVDTGSPEKPETATPQWVRSSYTKPNKKPSDASAPPGIAASGFAEQ